MEQEPSAPLPLAPYLPMMPLLDDDAPRLPWEERLHIGFFKALGATVLLLILNPADAFRRLRSEQDFINPLFFALIVTWFVVSCWAAWQFLIATMSAGFGHPQRFPDLLSLIIAFALYSILCMIGLFFSAGIVHLALLVLGHEPRLGYEGSFKVIAYAAIGFLPAAIPLIGRLIGGIYSLILIVIGLRETQQASPVKAILATAILTVASCLSAFLASYLLRPLFMRFAEFYLIHSMGS